jgi:TATA-box binding protein (TBP) (component of TFIID and TFIIIB)
MLASGKVLIAGGAANNLGLIWASAELYDPATGSFSSTGAMSSVRFLHTATLLASGKVLITGGQHVAGANWASAELYNP